MLINIGTGSTPSMIVKASNMPIVPYHLGNWTYVKPASPVKINASQIPIGKNWTYVYTLSSSSSYHVYLYGDWIGTLTDYDVYVYDPLGQLESMHTEAAGLPPHLGTTVDEPFFKPKYTGSYSFLIVNNPGESRGAAAATLMLIENVECNTWCERFLTGQVNFINVYNTTWAYEFSTNSSRIEVSINVPNTLDVYEARLYVMANPTKKMGSLLNGVPLAWEPGLYGNLDASKLYGGYNMKTDGFKHPEMTASCEFFGQDMLINYTSPLKGDTVLYHLVLIAENGNGTLRFMVKTDFNPPVIKILNPVSTVVPGNDVIITANVTDQDALESVLLNYTDDNWKTVYSTSMTHVVNQTYASTIPAQPAGTNIYYKILASDITGNTGETQGNYVVKDLTTMTIFLSNEAIDMGGKITIRGTVIPAVTNTAIELQFTMPNFTSIEKYTYAASNGTFTVDFTPSLPGTWQVQAEFTGNNIYLPSTSESMQFIVNNTWLNIIYTWLNIILSFVTQYLLYIVAAAGATASAVGFIIFWRRRE
jgi:hypothetical protein